MSNDNSTQAELERIRRVNIAFIKKVAKMRDLQKEYFKTRSIDVLHQSKALETEVDNYITRCFEALSKIEFNEKVEVIASTFDAKPVQP